MTTTKRQWASAIADITGEAVDAKKFRSVADAQTLFEQTAREMGISWDIYEDGSIALSDPSEQPEDEAPEEQPEAPEEQTADEGAAEGAAEAPEEQPEIPSMDERGRPAREADLDVIELLAAENPKRAGTKTWHRFALYKTGMTVAEFLEAGGRRVDLSWDAQRQFIRIVATADWVAEPAPVEETPADDVGATAESPADA